MVKAKNKACMVLGGGEFLDLQYAWISSIGERPRAAARRSSVCRQMHSSFRLLIQYRVMSRTTGGRTVVPRPEYASSSHPCGLELSCDKRMFLDSSVTSSGLKPSHRERKCKRDKVVRDISKASIGYHSFLCPRTRLGVSERQLCGVRDTRPQGQPRKDIASSPVHLHVHPKSSSADSRPCRPSGCAMPLLHHQCYSSNSTTPHAFFVPPNIMRARYTERGNSRATPPLVSKNTSCRFGPWTSK